MKRPANSRERYEVIAWDGCARWDTAIGKWYYKLRDSRSEARLLKRYFKSQQEWEYYKWGVNIVDKWLVVKIWDRKRREFIT